MTTTLDLRPRLGSRRFREFGRGLMTKTRSNRSRKRLFIAISGFEILLLQCECDLSNLWETNCAEPPSGLFALECESEP